MGKIRVKTLGDESAEKLQLEEAKKRREAKRTQKKSAEEVISKSSELAVDSNLHAIDQKHEDEKPRPKDDSALAEKEKKKAKKEKTNEKKQSPSKRYQEASMKIDKMRLYPLAEAVQLLKQVGTTKFDQTVELHINTTQKGISGQVSLPHGSGKTVSVEVATPETVDDLLKQIDAGKIEFDVLIATPAVMPKLARVARILGPKGMMPNPKNGTITDKPEELIKKFQSGQVNYKTESAAPIIHASVGRVSFPEKNIEENIKEFISAVGQRNIVNVTLKSTMSPGIKLNLQSIS